MTDTTTSGPGILVGDIGGVGIGEAAVPAPASAAAAAARRRVDARLLAGLLFLGFGVLGLLVARQYAPGTPARMGPGFFPVLISGLLVVAGVLLAVAPWAVGARGVASDAVTGVRPRPLVLVLGSIVVFGLAVEPLGLVISTVLVVLIGGSAVPDARWRGLVVTAAVLSLVAWFLFVVLLGLPLPVLPR